MRVGFLVQWYIGRGFWFEAFGFLVVTVDGDVANDIAFGPISPTTFAEMATLRKVVVVELGVKRVAVRALQEHMLVDGILCKRLLDVVDNDKALHLVLEYMDFDLKKFMASSSDIAKNQQVIKASDFFLFCLYHSMKNIKSFMRHGRGRAKEGRVRASSSLMDFIRGDHDSQDDELLGSPMQVLHED
ncbi:hypothetical protein LOK49_Contig331G00004 [Camellia lanceoleosa]|nr:hypothetical protein LOK49_Contig331G00004 [Camellia lanceoleosa]